MSASSQRLPEVVAEIVEQAKDDEGVKAWLLWLRAYNSSVRRGSHKKKPTKSRALYLDWTLLNADILKPTSAFKLVSVSRHVGWMRKLYIARRAVIATRERGEELKPLIEQGIVDLEAEARTDTSEAIETLEDRTDQAANAASVLVEDLEKARAQVSELEATIAEFEARERQWTATNVACEQQIRVLKEALEACEEEARRNNEEPPPEVDRALDLPPPPPPPAGPPPPPPPPPAFAVAQPEKLGEFVDATAEEAKEQADIVKATNDSEDLLGSVLAGRDKLKSLPEDFDAQREAARKQQGGSDTALAILARRIAIAGDEEEAEAEEEGEWGFARLARARRRRDARARFSRTQTEHLLDAAGGNTLAAARLGALISRKR